MYIYVDVLFLLNFGMNLLILYLTAQVAGCQYRWPRLTTAAAAAGLYAVGMPLLGLSLLYIWPVKLLASAFIVGLALGLRSARNFVFTFSVFYVISFVLGGAVIGWLFFIEGRDWLTPGAVFNISWIHVLGGAVIAAALLLLTGRSVLTKVDRRRMLHMLIIDYRSRQVKIPALLDSGNQLLSPLSKRPVILAEADSMAPILSEAAREYLSLTSPDAWLSELDRCSDLEWLSRVEPVLCRSIGGGSILLGFRPDRVNVETANGIVDTGMAIIGLHQGSLSPDGAYKALLHPLLIAEGSIRRRERANQVANY